jgi:hypothetical protein
VPDPGVGRILNDQEKLARSADESAEAIEGEVLRTAFSISSRHILTAWHCVHDSLEREASLWYRIRVRGQERHYAYIPVRVSNYNTQFDVAALAIDIRRLEDADLNASEAEQLLAATAIPLATNISANEDVILVGFPANATSADSDTISATIVDTDFPLGEVVGLKLFGPAFGTVSPVDPHGLSGGPVLRASPRSGPPDYSAVGIVRSIARGEIPYTAVGGGVIATRISDLVGLLPEVAVALSRRAEPEISAADRMDRSQDFPTLSRECLNTLKTTAIRISDPRRGDLMGWAHFFDESREHLRPTAISTAYGLKIAMAIDRPDGLLNRSRLTETLWKLRLSDGGWSARTGTTHSRPEITALILGALASAGYDRAHLAEAGEAFEATLSLQVDPVGLSHVYPVCAVIRGLVRARPESSRLPELKTQLIEGGIADPARHDLQCWASQLALGSDGTRRPVPSVPHTAMAIVALARANLVLGPDEVITSVLEQSTMWLCQHPDLANRNEQIRRYVDKDGPWEMLSIEHFTAAWVARALLAVQPTSVPESEALLRKAVRQVWQSQRDGIWNWDENLRPVWMTYQGICVLRDHSMLLGARVI